MCNLEIKMLLNKFSTFTSLHKVRPDDIDMFNHVHNSKYLDYVLAARYEQMESNYGMAMERFLEMGFGWVVKTVKVYYKRPLSLSDTFTVSTSIAEIHKNGCKVIFEILNCKTQKISADGYFDFVMIDLKTGRGATLTTEILEKYSI